MDGLLKELAKLEKLTSSDPSAKSKSPSINDSLDALIASLQQSRTALQSGTVPAEAVWPEVRREVERRKKDVEDRQKEVYSCVSRIGKGLDKRFPTAVPTFEPLQPVTPELASATGAAASSSATKKTEGLFSSAASRKAVEQTIATHLLRTGQFDTAELFLQESTAEIALELKASFAELHSIMHSLQNNDVGPALAWASSHRSFLAPRSSALEFHLHRAQFINLLTDPSSSLSPEAYATVGAEAFAYLSTHLTPFYATHPTAFRELSGAPIYRARLASSPYAHLLAPEISAELQEEFAREYCAALGMGRESPLRVVGDIGGGGALNRIEKGRKVMLGRGWSQVDELPIEIPLPPQNRYHSIFACPVSKEQTTDANPPMMIACGHVVAKDSLTKLSKPGGRVKCPYCPVEGQASSALRLYF